MVSVSPTESDVPSPGKWAERFEDTTVYVERVIAYWSRILKAAERNYSPTEREALALKEGLIKFQSFLEGSSVLAITDHAALTWSRTFQNVNRRLLTWGTVFAAYPGLKIIHRAGRVHSNVDPISRLRRRIPYQDGPSSDPTDALQLHQELEDPLKDMYEELGPQFEEKLIKVASRFCETLDQEDEGEELTVLFATHSSEDTENPWSSVYQASSKHSLLVGITPGEVQTWKKAYSKDEHFKIVKKNLETETDWSNPEFPQYTTTPEGLVYFEDHQGNSRLCVPEELRVQVMKEAHDLMTEGAHSGYHRSYNRIASTYYWPRMSRDIKKYVSTCDVCQKSKPRRHAPVGLLQPIPIPTRPFEVITMDFIPELPNSSGFDNILVIVDKLTKYGLFIPTTTKITEKETAALLFKHIFSEYGLPKQIISDRDVRWRGDFWKEVCRLMKIERSLTTSYHPQADGQTEILNQTLEIALRAYIGPSRDDWSDHLDGLRLSYNTSPHSATGYSPAYLLRGYHPITGGTLMNPGPSIPRSVSDTSHPEAGDMVDGFMADRHDAQEALYLGQVHQKRAYNNGRIMTEFEVGDKVVLNVDSLELLRSQAGRGRKLLMKYDGPFEIIRKISSVAYQVRLPASYGIHPVINIAHLERYHESPPEFGVRPTKDLARQDFNELPEFEVESIIAERSRKSRNGRRVALFKTRFVGYGPEYDEWLTRTQLRNAPDILKAWQNRRDRAVVASKLSQTSVA